MRTKLILVLFFMFLSSFIKAQDYEEIFENIRTDLHKLT